MTVQEWSSTLHRSNPGCASTVTALFAATDPLTGPAQVARRPGEVGPPGAAGYQLAGGPVVRLGAGPAGVLDLEMRAVGIGVGVIGLPG
jgi:hypothetical protein